MITPLDAWRSIVECTQALPVTHVDLASATGYVLSEPIVADRDVPPVNRSAMDGYAVRFADIENCPVTLNLVGEVAAGSDRVPVLNAGECVAIYTGANIPPSADTVVMVEDTQQPDETHVYVTKQPRAGQHIFRKGENAVQGEVLIAAGTVLGAAEAGVCAAVGVAKPAVFSKPRIAILSTGAELLDASDAVESHQLRNSNGPMLVAGLQTAGFAVSICRSVGDDEHDILSAINEMLEDCDFLIMTGGVSVGKYDLVPNAITQAGGTTHFHGIGIKPGKPQLFATISTRQVLYGLPGNPLSSMTGLQQFILPALRRMSGWEPDTCRPSMQVQLGRDLSSKPGRLRHCLARLTWTATGSVAMPVDNSGSADLVAASRANGTVVMPADVKALDAGCLVEFCPWGVGV